jgi:hypothetical protein
MNIPARASIAIVVLSALSLAVVGISDADRGAPGHGAPCPADALAAAQALVDASCVCEAGASHGRYVRCVAHASKRLLRDGSMERRCRSALVRGAARSTCGRPAGFVTCCRAHAKRTAACTLKRRAELCTARGGTLGATASCMDACIAGSPSGAFLD